MAWPLRRNVAMHTCRSSERDWTSMLACRLNDVNTGEKEGSLPDRLAESAASVEGEGGGAMEAPAVRLEDRPKETRGRRGDEREVDLYSAPALVRMG